MVNIDGTTAAGYKIYHFLFGPPKYKLEVYITSLITKTDWLFLTTYHWTWIGRLIDERFWTIQANEISTDMHYRVRRFER